MLQCVANAQIYFKIFIAEEGIYKIAGQELANAGIDISGSGRCRVKTVYTSTACGSPAMR